MNASKPSKPVLHKCSGIFQCRSISSVNLEIKIIDHVILWCNYSRGDHSPISYSVATGFLGGIVCTEIVPFCQDSSSEFAGSVQSLKILFPLYFNNKVTIERQGEHLR